MPAEKAKKHYLGKDGHRRLNCAQAVLAAFQDRFGITDEEIDRYFGHGAGNAPEGLCGAVWAARHLLEKNHPDKLKEFDDFFLDQAGSLKCDEIRDLRKLSCIGCIQKSAEFVAKSCSNPKI